MFISRFKRELCVICSAGGHLSEALELISATDADRFIVTKYEPHIAERLTDMEAYYINNPHTSLWGYFINAIRSLLLFIRHRPKIILTTGAGIALPMCLIGKIYGSKVIYVESGARVVTTSKMGRFLYKHKLADVFYVQWESMLKHHPAAKYAGRLI